MSLIPSGQWAAGRFVPQAPSEPIPDEWLLAKGSTQEVGRRPNGNWMNS